MTYKEEGIEEFKEIFESTKAYILSSDGCHGVRLLQDVQNPKVFFTYSTWRDEQALDQYRSSDYFRATWSRCKKLFDDKPQAWSTQVLSSSDHEKDIASEL